MNLPRTLDNKKLDKPTWGPIAQSLKQTAGRQDDDRLSRLQHEAIDQQSCLSDALSFSLSIDL